MLRADDAKSSPSRRGPLANLKGIGAEHAAVIWSEGFFRSFANRRQVAAYAGLAPTPWQSGSGRPRTRVSKAGNPRLRTAMIQLAWLWLRHQPGSALSRWFHERVRRTWRPLAAQNDDRCARAQAPHRPVEVCDCQRRHRRSCHEGLLINASSKRPLPNLRDLISLWKIRGGQTERAEWGHKPVYENGLCPLEPRTTQAG